jgi:hypothetical protein
MCLNCGCTSINFSQGEKGDQGEPGVAGTPGAPGATGGQTQATIIANTGTVALTELQTGGKVVLDRAAGSIITLPDAPADGTNYEFITKTDLTSNNYVINVGGAGLDSFNGYLFAKKAATTDEIFNTAGATAITMDGTTTGGDRGTEVKVSYSETENIWYVTGHFFGSGALTSPFS